jgi:hypothetical protein
MCDVRCAMCDVQCVVEVPVVLRGEWCVMWCAVVCVVPVPCSVCDVVSACIFWLAMRNSVQYLVRWIICVRVHCHFLCVTVCCASVQCVVCGMWCAVCGLVWCAVQTVRRGRARGAASQLVLAPALGVSVSGLSCGRPVPTLLPPKVCAWHVSPSPPVRCPRLSYVCRPWGGGGTGLLPPRVAPSR